LSNREERQVTMQLGSSMAVFDAGVAALKSTVDPLDKAALAKSISTLKTITTVGEIDFNTGPMPHVVATTRFVGTQYQKTKPGSKWKAEQVVIENSEDPNVPIGGKIIPYHTGA
jgi:branched-chain amino acid transport system substrate-binding protein